MESYEQEQRLELYSTAYSLYSVTIHQYINHHAHHNEQKKVLNVAIIACYEQLEQLLQ